MGINIFVFLDNDLASTRPFLLTCSKEMVMKSDLTIQTNSHTLGSCLSPLTEYEPPLTHFHQLLSIRSGAHSLLSSFW